jgi:hypothetical protein
MYHAEVNIVLPASDFPSPFFLSFDAGRELPDNDPVK